MFHPIIRKMDLDTGRALVREEFFRGHLVRMLTVDGAMESAVYKDKNLRDKPPFYYQESMFSLMAEEGYSADWWRRLYISEGSSPGLSPGQNAGGRNRGCHGGYRQGMPLVRRDLRSGD